MATSGRTQQIFLGCSVIVLPFTSSARNLIVPLIKFFAAYMKHPIHIREGGVIEITRPIGLCVAAIPCVNQFIYQLVDHCVVIGSHEQNSPM